MDKEKTHHLGRGGVFFAILSPSIYNLPMSERYSFDAIPQHKSLEALREEYRRRLDVILDKQLTVENIEVFADEALSETIKLTDEVLTEYGSNPEFQADTTQDTQKQEDDAFSKLNLPDIQEVLQSIIDVKDKIDFLKTYIHTNIEHLDEVITPPQEVQVGAVQEGEGSFIEKRMFPRLLTLLYIIEHDFEISSSDVKVTEGVVTPDMMRKTPYVRVEIADLNRAVYICDEEGNASYVFDTEKLRERGLTLEEIDVDDKRDKNSLISHYPGIGVRLIKSNKWRGRVAGFLKEPIPEIQTGIEVQEEKEEREERSEFGRERKNWPSFDEFQAEVRELYPGEGGVIAWFIEEKKKHPNWYSRPAKLYKDKGWIGWSELVGTDKHLNKDFLPFVDFQDEVRSLYPGEGDIYIHGLEKKIKNIQIGLLPLILNIKMIGKVGQNLLAEKIF